MESLDLLEAAPLSALKDCIGQVCFGGAREFRREVDMEIVGQLRGLAPTPSARDAAAELARDCGALAENIALAGPDPTQGWRDVIENDRSRARESVERFAVFLSECVRLDSKTGGPRIRPGSVPMKRKSFQRPH